jgi:hypothetical protein
MKWLRKKIIQWVREDWDAEYKKSSEKGVLVSNSDINVPEDDPILTFRIYSANNGQILEFRRYDRKNDRHNNSTYIIEKDRDIGEYINKCLSLELLK